MFPEIEEVISGARRYCVITADNREVLPTIPDRAVAHVITDPPYEAAAHTLARRLKSGPRRTAVAPGKVQHAPLTFAAITEEERDAAALQFARIAARWIVAFCQVEAAPRWATSLEAHGARYMRTCVWVKPDGQPQLTGDRPGMGYEAICVGHAPGKSRWNGGGRVGVFTHNTARLEGITEHQTPKPLALMLELIELFTDPGDVVIDPFCGSGTTGVACVRLGRRFIGIDREAKYTGLSAERIEAEAQGLTVHDARAGQLSLLGGAA